MFVLFVQAVFLFFLTGLMHAETMNVDNGLVSSSSDCICAFAPKHSMVYLTGNNLENPMFSLSSIAPLTNKKGFSVGFKAEGLVPEKITLDYKEDTENPLFKKMIQLLALLENRPLVVIQQDPATLFYINSVGKSFSALATPPVNDADGQQTGGIIKLCTGVSFSPASKNFNNYIIAAVKNHDGLFGSNGSGLALIKLDSYKEEIEVPQEQKESGQEQKAEKIEQVRLFLNVLDAAAGDSKENKAIDLTQCTDAFSIQDGLDYIQSNAIDMHWDSRFGRCYIALQLKTKDTATSEQGVCALASATIVNDRLVLQPMAYHSALRGNIGIIGATGANQSVSLHKVRTLHTSTALPYLIVVGGNGTPETTQKTVSALPLALKGTNDFIASKHSEIDTIYRGRPAIIFDNRQFKHVAELPGQLPTADDRAVHVGAGALLPTAITDITVVQDAVYVTVENSLETGESGIYHSQPIFDGTGAIAAWTPWQRVVASDFSIFGMDLNPTDGSFLFLEKEFTDQGTHIIMHKTGWKQADILDESAEKDGAIDLKQREQTLDVVFNNYFDSQEGGIQGLFDIPATHEALQNISLVIATGYKKVAVAQTGLMLNGVCKALQEPIVRCFSDDVINELGPINAATIAHDGRQAWLFVAGVEGLAVLCYDDGSGWSLHDGLQHGLNELEGMSFKKITSFSYVQKLMADGTHLYVLTQSRLERIALNEQHMLNAPLRSQCLADGMQLPCKYPAGLYDAVVSNTCAVLATSQGLFVTDVNNDNQWRHVPLPIQDELVCRLFVVSSTGSENGFSKNGQLYVLTQSLHEKSRVYRFYVSDNSIVPVPDHFRLQQAHDYFCNLSSLATFFVTDGSLYIHAQNRTTVTKPDLIFFPEEVMGGKGIQYHTSKRAPVQIETAEKVTAITRNWATGGWMIAGDFGLRITQ